MVLMGFTAKINNSEHLPGSRMSGCCGGRDLNLMHKWLVCSETGGLVSCVVMVTITIAH